MTLSGKRGNYLAFYDEEGKFRESCDAISKYDLSPWNEDHALSSGVRDMLRKHAKEFHIWTRICVHNKVAIADAKAC